MKTLLTGMCVLTLVAATGCTQSAPDEQAAEGPATGPPTAEPEQPVAGEEERTFSLSVPFEPVELTQGDEEPVLIGINRGENFGEEVTLEVSGLPMGVTVEPEDAVIAQGSTGVTFTLKAADDAALGDFTASVTGHTTSSSADFSKEINITVVQK